MNKAVARSMLDRVRHFSLMTLTSSLKIAFVQEIQVSQEEPVYYSRSYFQLQSPHSKECEGGVSISCILFLLFSQCRVVRELGGHSPLNVSQ